MAQKGPLYLARETQGPILPVAVAARRKLTFDTWDRFELPLPLSRLALLVGEPLPGAARRIGDRPWRPGVWNWKPVSTDFSTRANHIILPGKKFCNCPTLLVNKGCLVLLMC